LKAGRSRRAAGLYGIDPGAHGLFAVQHEHAGEEMMTAKTKFAAGPGNDNGDALEHRLEHESSARAGQHP
jgi:hypothetical protein